MAGARTVQITRAKWSLVGSLYDFYLPAKYLYSSAFAQPVITTLHLQTQLQRAAWEGEPGLSRREEAHNQPFKIQLNYDFGSLYTNTECLSSPFDLAVIRARLCRSWKRLSSNAWATPSPSCREASMLSGHAQWWWSSSQRDGDDSPTKMISQTLKEAFPPLCEAVETIFKSYPAHTLPFHTYS